MSAARNPRPAAARRGWRVAAALHPDWMGHNVTVLLAARIPMSATRALGGVVVPIYLALLGFSAVELGELFVAAGLAAALISALSGTISDRTGRRAFLVVVPALAAAAAAAFALTTDPAVLFVAAALGSFGRGAGAGAGAVGPYQPVESAVAAQSTAARWRNAAFGRMSAASSVGALCGGLLAIVGGGGHPPAAAAFAAYRPVFLVAAGLAASASLLGLAVREPPRVAAGTVAAGTVAAGTVAAGTVAAGGTEEGGRTGRRPRPAAHVIAFPRRSLPLLTRLWAANTVNGVAVGMFGPFVTYWFFRRFGVGPAQLGVLYAVINAVTVVSGLGAATVARRLGLLRAVVVTQGVQAALLIPLALAPTFWLAGLIYLARMGAQRVALPLRQSFVLAAADPTELASVAALSNLPSQVAMAGSPMATGYLFDEVSLDLPFLVAGGLQALNAVLYWVSFRGIVPEEERTPASVPTASR